MFALLFYDCTNTDRNKAYWGRLNCVADEYDKLKEYYESANNFALISSLKEICSFPPLIENDDEAEKARNEHKSHYIIERVLRI